MSDKLMFIWICTCIIIAIINSANCTEGDIRLYGNTQPREGILHVCTGGVWSTVCHRYWDTGDTNVACHELGYTAYGKLYCKLTLIKISR